MQEMTPNALPGAGLTTIMKIVFFSLLAGIFSYALMPDSMTIEDKLGLSCAPHFLAFVTLAFAIDLAYPQSGNLRKAWVLTGYGILIEAVQYFIPYRSCSFWDLMIDVLGIAAYFLGVQKFIVRWAKKPA